MSGKLFAKIALILLLGILGIITLFPIFWMYSSTFKPYKEIFAYPPTLLPIQFTLGNLYSSLFEHRFLRYMGNSLYVALVVTLVALLLHAMAGYAFARLDFPLRDTLFVMLISTLIIPIYSILIPRYILVNQLGWINTYAGLIIPAIPHGFGIFALRQFLLGLPIELEEAARIDGASRVKIFLLIALPLCKTILVTLGVIFFMVNWDAFIWPLVVAVSDDLKLIQVGLAGFMDLQTPQWHLLIASASLAATPNLIVFLLAQRYVVQGIKTTGLK
jgi:multiple sugar transport system permease protein